MDKTLKSTVYRITGAIPANNYIQLPKTSTQSLGLSGRFLYLLFRPVAAKYFVVHVDVVTQDGLVIRISFSNLFKEFKTTSTWLQFPFVCHASKSSVSGVSAQLTKGGETVGRAPISTQWTVLCLDFQEILTAYLSRQYSHIKSIKLCANLAVKNIYTSDNYYVPGLTMDQVAKSGITLSGAAPMPREMAFPLGNTENWNDLYDFIRFPSSGMEKSFDSIQRTRSLSADREKGPQRADTRTVHISKSEATSSLYNMTKPPFMTKCPVTSELPQVGVNDKGEICVQQGPDGDVHVHASGLKKVVVHQENEKTGKVTSSKIAASAVLPPVKEKYKCLKPDPILRLKRIVGFGGATTRNVLWNHNGTVVVYPCHAAVIAMQTSNGQQRFFTGHTDKVSCIALNSDSTLLASGQTGSQSVVRLWRFNSGECLAIFRTHSHSVGCLSMSHSGNSVCGVGKDSHGKNLVVIWNTERVAKGGNVTVLVKAHTDVDIVSMRIASFDETRMVSCGRDNIRLWRIKDGSLRSAPVNLGEYHAMEFADCCFEAGFEPNKDPLDRVVYAGSRSGHIFEIDYRKVTVRHVRRLQASSFGNKSGSGLALNCLCVNESFCVTGSDDGFVRLWPLDFKQVFLEMEHDGPVTAVDVSSDGLQLLVGTCTGNIGILDISTRSYTTIMRSHTGRILSMSLDSLHRRMATVSEDHTIRIWDLETMQLLSDFTAPKDSPCAVAYHPSQQVIACGFDSGAIRIFSIGTMSMLAEHKQHRGAVIGLAFNLCADFLYSAGSLGSIALYDTSDNQYQLLRLLGNIVALGVKRAPEAFAVSPDGKSVAFVGPTDFIVTVVNATSLDEIMRIDITNLSTIESNRNVIDGALRVKYSPLSVKQLLVTTSNNKLLKFDARTGKIISEIDNIHRSGCTSIDVSPDGRYLLTAGDKVIKVWDYHMRLDLNFQVFIGHSESISRVLLTPDSLNVLSVGDAIFIWEFLAGNRIPEPPAEGRTTIKNYFTGHEEELSFFKTSQNHPLTDEPIRKSIRVLSSYAPGEPVPDVSIIEKQSKEELLGEEVMSRESSDGEDFAEIVKAVNGKASLRSETNGFKTGQEMKITMPAKNPISEGVTSVRSKPTVAKHFIPREKKCALAQRRYVALPSQAGLKLDSVIGYNGNGRGNMIWHADGGFFSYTNGSVVVVEDVKACTQRHLLGHSEEISTLALQHDFQILASASGSYGLSTSQICIWDLPSMILRTTLSHHEFDIICLDYSRDDRFLISVGDYRECSVVVWSAINYAILTSTKTSIPMNDLKWDPYTTNEFASVGEHATVLFWLLDETAKEASLSVHEAKIPDELLTQHHSGTSEVSFTSLEYAGDSILFVGTSTGKVSAWDTRKNSCFMHWEADTHEIDILVSRRGRLVTGGSGHSLRLWSVVGIGEMKMPSDSRALHSQGLTMEDEMNLDGLITSASFDDTMDVGVVGTSAGTLWYVNWVERASIQLVSGHGTQINAVLMHGDDFILTGCEDGSIHVLSTENRQRTVQFRVLNQSCKCLGLAPTQHFASKTVATVGNLNSAAVVAHSNQSNPLLLPRLVAGYSDGTVRVFDLNAVKMILKMHPHAAAVTAVTFTSDGRMILSGGDDGLVAVSSAVTGMTVRVISDHKGAAISCLDVTVIQDLDDPDVSSPQLWLATSVDRRVSIWSADWSKDFCEMIDWLTFPAPPFAPDGTKVKVGETDAYKMLPPSIAKFSSEEPDVIVYTGYGMQKQLQFHSLAEKQILRTAPLTHWASALDISPLASLIAIGNQERLVKLFDYYEHSFQDFVGHSDSVDLVKFSSSGKFLVSVSHSEIFLWTVAV